MADIKFKDNAYVVAFFISFMKFIYAVIELLDGDVFMKDLELGAVWLLVSYMLYKVKINE